VEDENKELGIRHIRLSVKEDTDERGFHWEREERNIFEVGTYAML
jgi:hypothetical protein